MQMGVARTTVQAIYQHCPPQADGLLGQRQAAAAPGRGCGGLRAARALPESRLLPTAKLR